MTATVSTLRGVERTGPGRGAAARDATPAAPTELTGWGMHPVVRAYERRSEDLEDITRGATLTRGLGRSYGDASLPAAADRVVANSTYADRLLSFDPDTGVLRAEAGLSLFQMNRIFMPRGFFTPVSPGTQFVTVGGMVASDVHGKSHHVDGCFGEHVRGLKMRVADGRVVECSDSNEPELFRATLGGMGLTGHLLEVEFRMKRIPSPWIWQESERLPDVEAVAVALKEASRNWPFTVCWMDCLRRGKNLGCGILQRGRWAEPSEVRKAFAFKSHLLGVPFLLPEFLPRTLGVTLFNQFYYWQHGEGVRRGIIHPESFWYPLDVVLHWNRLYGRRGFTQYQCVLPVDGRTDKLRKFLELLQDLGGTPFVCVTKDCGPEGKGMISFPKPGISFALDLPVRSDTQRIVDALNDVVAAEGGRIYLAKDAFTRAEHFRAMEPRLDDWNRVRRQWDPEARLRSALSVRLLGDTA